LNLLVDTHVAIWALTAPRELGARVGALLADRDNQVHVSVVSIWEIGIKYPLGKRSSPPFPAREAIQLFEQANFRTLDVKPEHAVAVESLPLLHADPFDRLLVAQALTEPMRLVSRDRLVIAYSDSFITW
jgi:PIN domain nuclease of toxin-antitoxin system